MPGSLRLESYRPVGLVRTSEQAKRNDKDGHKVIGAINADFFSFKTGWPVNNQVRNGEFVFGTQTQRSHFILDDQNRPHIERTSFDGWAGRPRGNKFRIAGVNDVHSDSVIILHTSFSDSATSSTGKGRTVSLTLLNSSWSVCDTMRMIVSGAGSEDLKNISSGRAVLWIGNGASVSAAAEEMKSGDTLLVYLGVRPVVRNAKTILGGFGKIVSDGRPVSDSTNLEEKTNLNFLTARHPRTFVGFDRDSTKLYLCVVDGRQQKSVGMNFREMADFLVSIGVWNAVNFDGGGSTTMVLQGRIVNSPSDVTGERPVANTLQIIELGPPGNAR
ncbi:MAG: phosphodiester glycosidase family protein [Ignavibacteriales bacterium]|nr:phosphodiester glycosidase family protein [Ignavibacteriales bacterium]